MKPWQTMARGIRRGLDRVGPWRILAVALLAAGLLAGKSYYASASADDLRWILAPTSWLVSAMSGVAFTFESGTGYVSREAAFIIAPACAGLNFLFAATLALASGWLPGMVSGRTTARLLARAAVLALAATLAINTTRIVIAMALHHGRLPTLGLGPDEIHRAEGVVVYLGGLVALYGLARRQEAPTISAPPISAPQVAHG